MKLTVESLKQIIKEELGYGNRDDNAPMDIAHNPERIALDNLAAAVDSLVQNLGYTIEEVLETVQELGESSGVSTAMKGDEIIATRKGDEITRKGDEIETTRELEECGYPEGEEEEDPPRYFKI